MEEEFEYDEVELEKKLNQLEKLFCETVLEEIKSGGIVPQDDLYEAISYFSEREEFEKCVILKKAL